MSSPFAWGPRNVQTTAEWAHWRAICGVQGSVSLAAALDDRLIEQCGGASDQGHARGPVYTTAEDSTSSLKSFYTRVQFQRVLLEKCSFLSSQASRDLFGKNCNRKLINSEPVLRVKQWMNEPGAWLTWSLHSAVLDPRWPAVLGGLWDRLYQSWKIKPARAPSPWRNKSLHPRFHICPIEI